jgi:small redox-active disulfide protein 2
MEIKILGTGCTKCKNLEQKVRDYIKEKNIEANIVKEENIFEIMKYGVMTTPALVINDKVELKGILPDKEQLEKIISKYVI